MSSPDQLEEKVKARVIGAIAPGGSSVNAMGVLDAADAKQIPVISALPAGIRQLFGNSGIPIASAASPDHSVAMRATDPAHPQRLQARLDEIERRRKTTASRSTPIPPDNGPDAA